MARYRNSLPQLDGRLFLTDGGIETTLIFREGLDLPLFAAFDLLKNAGGEAALRRYFEGYAALARRLGAGLILESATWRANPDWGARLGYSREALAEANRQAIRLLEEIRERDRRRRDAGRDQRMRRAAGRRLRARPDDDRTRRPRAITPSRSRPSPARRRTWSPRSR